MAETRRRLPVWMHKQKTETRTITSNSDPRSEQIQNEENLINRRHGRKISDSNPDKFNKKEAAMQRCQSKQTVGRIKNRSEIENGDEKQGNRGSVKRKRTRKRRSGISDNDDVDEIELTVDDLVSIAKEYVNADRDHEETNIATTTTQKNSIKNALKPVRDLGLTTNSLLSKCTTSKPSLDSSTNTLNERNNSTEERNISSNDAARDMLDMFLGPLLKEPPLTRESVMIPVEEALCPSFVDASAYEEERDVIERKGPVLLTKKKSSLKAKVAEFLN